MSFPFTRGRKSKAQTVSIKKPVYTMASTDGLTAEVTMYGDIYEEQPTDWWGEPIEGQFILLSEFMTDLRQLANCKDITIRINSYGGDAGAANTIHNRLRELARNGAKLTCIVDGVAMSGGSIIMCACDTVKVNPSSLIMIHKCWSFLWGGYNADELREEAAERDAWDKMQVEAYKRKTGLDEAEILSMMAETTYMTGREAVEKGFADELLEDAEPVNIAASADGRSFYVRGKQMHLAPGMFAPDTIPTVTPAAAAAVETHQTQPGNTGAEGGKQMEPKEKQGTEPVAAGSAPAVTAPDQGAIQAAVQAEQQRIRDIDAIASLFDEATVNAAKYGDTACTAQEMAYRAAQTAAQQGKRFLSDLQADAQASGSQKVGAAPGGDPTGGEEPETPEAKLAAARLNIKALLGKDQKKEG